MKVCVIGGGGREHTLAWKLAQSDSVEKVYAIPGSKAMEDVAECIAIDWQDFGAVTDFFDKRKYRLGGNRTGSTARSRPRRCGA